MKSVFLTTTLLFFSSLLVAQIEVGVHFSYGSAWQEYAEDFPVEGNTLKIDGYRMGASVYYPVSPLLAVGIEPGYARRGAACEPGFVWNNVFQVEDATLYANYIELPLFLQARFNLWNQRLFALPKLGAGAAYMLSGYRDVVFINPETPDERQDIDFSNEPQLNRWDFGLQGALGIGLNIGPGQLQLEGRYYHGILDASDQLTSENRSLTFGVNYVLRF